MYDLPLEPLSSGMHAVSQWTLRYVLYWAASCCVSRYRWRLSHVTLQGFNSCFDSIILSHTLRLWLNAWWMNGKCISTCERWVNTNEIIQGQHESWRIFKTAVQLRVLYQPKSSRTRFATETLYIESNEHGVELHSTYASQTSVSVERYIWWVVCASQLWAESHTWLKLLI